MRQVRLPKASHKGMESVRCVGENSVESSGKGHSNRRKLSRLGADSVAMKKYLNHKRRHSQEVE